MNRTKPILLILRQIATSGSIKRSNIYNFLVNYKNLLSFHCHAYFELIDNYDQKLIITNISKKTKKKSFFNMCRYNRSIK